MIVLSHARCVAPLYVVLPALPLRAPLPRTAARRCMAPLFAPTEGA